MLISPATAPSILLLVSKTSLPNFPSADKFSFRKVNKPLSATFPAFLASFNFLIAAPAPPKAPVNKAPSVPNLILFKISLPGS